MTSTQQRSPRKSIAPTPRQRAERKYGMYTEAQIDKLCEHLNAEDSKRVHESFAEIPKRWLCL